MSKKRQINYRSIYWANLNKRKVIWAIRIEGAKRYQMTLCTQCIVKLNKKAVKKYPTNMSIFKRGKIGGRMYPVLRYGYSYDSLQIQPQKCENCGWREKK